jgi:hypothetical protein
VFRRNTRPPGVCLPAHPREIQTKTKTKGPLLWGGPTYLAGFPKGLTSGDVKQASCYGGPSAVGPSWDLWAPPVARMRGPARRRFSTLC